MENNKSNEGQNPIDVKSKYKIPTQTLKFLKANKLLYKKQPGEGENIFAEAYKKSQKSSLQG